MTGKFACIWFVTITACSDNQLPLPVIECGGWEQVRYYHTVAIRDINNITRTTKRQRTPIYHLCVRVCDM